MNRMCVIACALGAAVSVHAAGFVETYAVNAQYRGAVKKGYQEIGEGKVAYDALEGTGFRVRALGQVRHPDDGRVYAFKAYESFELSGSTITSTGVERRELNEHARPHEEKITEVMPFAYLVRVLRPPRGDGDPTRTFTFRQKLYTLRWRRTERNVEVDLLRDDTLVGKFFLLPGTGPVAPLEKFRIPIPAEKLVVSFIVAEHRVVR